MTGNSFGVLFNVTTWGESHGKAVGCVVDGCPSGLELTLEDVQKELDRRRPGQSSITTQRGEEDKVDILSGLFENKTLGTPIAMLIQNKDADSSKYLPIKDMPRPGHGDYTWLKKFGFTDWRGGGRGSGRETVGRVAAGAVAKKLLSKTLGVEVIGYAREIAGLKAEGEVDLKRVGELRDIVESNAVRCFDLRKAKEMEVRIREAKGDGDSVGGVVEAVALNVPAGFGEPVFDKLDADLAKALMSIPAVKGVEVGGGFHLAGVKGGESNDGFILRGGEIETKTNNCGGILGGISDGMPIIVRVAIKPTPSISKKQNTVNLKTMKEEEILVEGRHDPCIVPRAVPVVEAMIALVLADHGLRNGAIPRRL